MSFVASFMILLQGVSGCFTKPTLQNFLTILQGWVLTRRHTITGMILGANAAGTNPTEYEYK